MKLKYTLEFNRIAVLQTPKGLSKIGDITFFEQQKNGDIALEVEVDPKIPKEIHDAIIANPAMIGIQSVPKMGINALVLA